MNEITPIRFVGVIAIALTLTGCVKWHSGLDPVVPKPGYIVQPTVNTLTPFLEWEALAPRTGMSNVTYALVILDTGLDRWTAEVIYARQGLTGTTHQVESALTPGRVYAWRVRPEYQTNGKQKEGSWNSYSFIGPVWGFGVPYSFRTPREAAE